jgi:outer membrane protein TolC
MALDNSPLLAEARLSLEHARVQHAQARHARFVPGLDVRNVWGPIPKRAAVYQGDVLTSPDTSFSFSNLRYFTDLELNIVQPLFTFGKLSGLSRAAHNAVLADEANLQKTEQEVQLKTRELYWGLVMGKELLVIVQKAREDVDKAETKVRDLLDEGSDEITQTDLYKLELFKYEVMKRQREAVVRYETAQSGLRVFLDLDDAVTLDLASEFIEPLDFRRDSLETYYNLALYHRPEVEQLRAGLNARRALLTVANSEFYPQFFVAGQIKYNYAKDVFDPNNPFVYNPTNFFRPGIVVGFRWNLNFVQVRDKSRLAYVEWKQLEQKESFLLDGIKVQVQTAYLQLNESETNLQDSGRALKASQNWLRSESMKWDIGTGEIKDLIDAYKANTAMESDHLQNIFKLNVAIAKLSQAVGRDLYKDQN